jgi:transposase
MSSNNNRYSGELKQRAVRMYHESRPDYPSETATVAKVAELLGIASGESVRRWVHQAEVDAGARPGVTTEEAAEIKRLKRENAELRRANAILKAASAFFAAELDRPGQ